MTEISDEGRKLAAKLANAEMPDQLWSDADLEHSGAYIALARLAAEHEKAVADLREIDRIADTLNWQGAIPAIRDLAAKYRETDPLVEALNAAWGNSFGVFMPESGDILRAELSQRGFELARVKP